MAYKLFKFPFFRAANVTTLFVVSNPFVAQELLHKLGFSIGKVSNDALNEVPAADPANALRGKVSGVRIVQSFRKPCFSSSNTFKRIYFYQWFSVSQLSSMVSSPTEVFVTLLLKISNLSRLSRCSCIFSYGSLAGNGVVQVITKKGKRNQKARVTIKQEVGFSSVNGEYPLTTKHPYLTAPLATGDWDNDPSTPDTSNFGFDLSSGNRVLDRCQR